MAITILDAAVAAGGHVEPKLGIENIYVTDCPVKGWKHGRRGTCQLDTAENEWRCSDCKEMGDLADFCSQAGIELESVAPLSPDQFADVHRCLRRFDEVGFECAGIRYDWFDLVMEAWGERYQRRSSARRKGARADSRKRANVMTKIDALRAASLLLYQRGRRGRVFTSRQKLKQYLDISEVRVTEALKVCADHWGVQQAEGEGMAALWDLPVMSGDLNEYIPIPASALVELKSDDLYVLVYLHGRAEYLRRGKSEGREKLLPLRYRFKMSITDIAKDMGIDRRVLGKILGELDTLGYFSKEKMTLTPARARDLYEERGGKDAPKNVWARLKHQPANDYRALHGLAWTAADEDDEDGADEGLGADDEAGEDPGDSKAG